MSSEWNREGWRAWGRQRRMFWTAEPHEDQAIERVWGERGPPLSLLMFILLSVVPRCVKDVA